ncbi:MAG: DEAD/DEAH box helicase [Spirochaetaceae bacterium]|jgi:superfamily II DNA/RNA helicase|nr:DEAD/DEAH box helicase [Spirochaetaceae bacterium]
MTEKEEPEKRQEKKFEDFGVSAFFADRLFERRIKIPTEIQQLVIPRIFAGENVLFRSATGTGKTFAYMLPFFQMLLGDALPAAPKMLILAPTLELCGQIKQEADFLGSQVLRTSLLIGSANMNRQIQSLRKEKPAVIIGNPARLLQLERLGKLNLNHVSGLVLDEGDRLISDELFQDTQALVNRVNRNRQIALCSATMSDRSKERLLTLTGPAVIVETAAQEILRDYILHLALFAEPRQKISALCSFLIAAKGDSLFLGKKKEGKILVFTNRKGQVGNIVSRLQYQGFAAAGISGAMDKQGRKQSIDGFRAGRHQILVASDLAARGLDIPGITCIVELDVSDDSESYIHRAGRTARAGNRGTMLTIGDAEELRRFAVLEKKLGIIVYPKILYQGRICDPKQFLF